MYVYIIIIFVINIIHICYDDVLVILLCKELMVDLG